MARDSLASIQDGTDTFIDANIFVYSFTGASLECQEFLARCARQEVFGITSFEAVNEVTHRLMIGEAFQKGLIARPRGRDLEQRPALVQALADYWNQVSQIFSMNLVLVATKRPFFAGHNRPGPLMAF
jgi:predicted nucleic acid-binding protein